MFVNADQHKILHIIIIFINYDPFASKNIMLVVP